MNARLDLIEMNIQEELAPREVGNTYLQRVTLRPKLVESGLAKVVNMLDHQVELMLMMMEKVDNEVKVAEAMKAMDQGWLI